MQRHFAFLTGSSRCAGSDGKEARAACALVLRMENGLNALLHEFREYIIGRMGIPYRARGINIISIFLDAPQDAISSLAGKIGNLDGISVKTVCSNVQYTD